MLLGHNLKELAGIAGCADDLHASPLKKAGATGVTVDTEQAGDLLIVRITTDGSSGNELEAGLSDVADRVGALGGKLRVEGIADGTITIRAEIPCAS